MKKVIIRLLLVTIVARAYIDNRAAQAQTIAVDSSRAKAASRGPGRDTLFPVVSDPKPLTPLMERELRGCFDFFWNEWISDPASPTYGMTAGDYVGLHSYSPVPVEEQGFYFAAIVIGVERGWISREDGEKRILITLNSLDLRRIDGFWYHFIDPDSGRRGWKNSPRVELSNSPSIWQIRWTPDPHCRRQDHRRRARSVHRSVLL